MQAATEGEKGRGKEEKAGKWEKDTKIEGTNLPI
jgi:hypothetical protein